MYYFNTYSNVSNVKFVKGIIIINPPPTQKMHSWFTQLSIALDIFLWKLFYLLITIRTYISDKNSPFVHITLFNYEMWLLYVLGKTAENSMELY